MNWKVSHVPSSQTIEHVCCVNSIFTIGDIVLIWIGIFPIVIGIENSRVVARIFTGLDSAVTFPQNVGVYSIPTILYPYIEFDR